MSKKSLIIVLIIIIVAIGFWWYGSKQEVKTPINNQAPLAETQTKTLQNVIKESGSSDAALNQDMSAIDKELNGLGVDSENIGNDLNNI